MRTVALSGFDEALRMGLQARFEISKKFHSVMNEPELSDLIVPPTVLFNPKEVDGIGNILGELRPMREELAEINDRAKARFGLLSGIVLFSAALPKGYEEDTQGMVEVDGIPIFQMGSGYHEIIETLNTCNEVRHAFFAFLKHEVGKALQLYRDTCFVVKLWSEKGEFAKAHKELSQLPEIVSSHRQQLRSLEAALQNSRFVRLQSIGSYFLVPETMAGGIESHDEVFSGDFVSRQTGAAAAVAYLLEKLGEIEHAYSTHLSSARGSEYGAALQNLQIIIDECAESLLVLGRTWQI